MCWLTWVSWPFLHGFYTSMEDRVTTKDMCFCLNAVWVHLHTSGSISPFLLAWGNQSCHPISFLPYASLGYSECVSNPLFYKWENRGPEVWMTRGALMRKMGLFFQNIFPTASSGDFSNQCLMKASMAVCCVTLPRLFIFRLLFFCPLWSQPHKAFMLKPIP